MAAKFCPPEDNITSTLVWIRSPALPLELFDEVLKKMCSAMVKQYRWINNPSKGPWEICSVCVELDSSKPLAPSVNVLSKSRRVEYEGLFTPSVLTVGNMCTGWTTAGRGLKAKQIHWPTKCHLVPYKVAKETAFQMTAEAQVAVLENSRPEVEQGHRGGGPSFWSRDPSPALTKENLPNKTLTNNNPRWAHLDYRSCKISCGIRLGMRNGGPEGKDRGHAYGVKVAFFGSNSIKGENSRSANTKGFQAKPKVKVGPTHTETYHEPS